MVERVRKARLFLGIFLIMLGILFPLILTFDDFNIMYYLNKSIIDYDKLSLLIGGILLVLLNTVRALPHYVGAFFVSESIQVDSSLSFSKYVKPIIIFTLISSVYFIIWIFYPRISYHFGVPAVTMILLTTLIGGRSATYISSWKKVLLIIMFILAFQFLDIMPFINSLPFGKGEISKEVKLIGHFLNAEKELNILSSVAFLLFFSFGLLVFMLIRDENRLKGYEKLKQENLILENKSKMKDLENRVHLEMRNLVHDLKSPLTSAQALVSLVKVSLQQNAMEKEFSYLTKVEDSIDNMSNMISEILNEDVKFEIETENILNATLANMSKYENNKNLFIFNKVPKSKIKVNKINFTRALVNIIENAQSSIKNKEDGKIEIIIEGISIEDEKYIEISILDNGQGIKRSDLENIFKPGFSTKGSHGLGLSFVKRTIDKSNGELVLYSEEGIGTTVTIILKEA